MTSMSSLLDPWAVLFQLVEEDQRLKSWVGNQKKGSESSRDPGEDLGLEQTGETGEMTLQLIPDPHLLTFF